MFASNLNESNKSLANATNNQNFGNQGTDFTS